MGQTTGITWAHSTHNGWWGCDEVSPGCDHCYARTFSQRLGFEIWGQGPRRFFGDKHWNEPRKWNQKAAESGEQWRVFAYSMADVLERHVDPAINAQLNECRERQWQLINETPNLTWLLLTKRPWNAPEMMPLKWQRGNPPRNVWFGTTVEDNERSRLRLEALRRMHARGFLTWISAEPLLEHVDWLPYLSFVKWIVFGGESGPTARPFDLVWARHGIAACRAAGVAPFMKQYGSRPIDSASGLDIVVKGKGDDLREWDPDLCVQNFPERQTA